jgi:hypothetical protein
MYGMPQQRTNNTLPSSKPNYTRKDLDELEKKARESALMRRLSSAPGQASSRPGGY